MIGGVRMSNADYAQMLKVLSDETRLRIIQLLSKKNLCACQLLYEVSITQATLSYHMKQLQDSGLVFGTKDGYWTRYSLEKEKLLPLVKMFDELIEDVELITPPIQCVKRD